MAELPGVLMPHRIRVERFLGEGSEGPSWEFPVPDVQCRAEGTLTVDADGQYHGSVKVYTRLRHRVTLNPGARVTFADGGRGRVTAVAPREDGGLGAWQHLEVVVTGGGA